MNRYCLSQLTFVGLTVKPLRHYRCGQCGFCLPKTPRLVFVLPASWKDSLGDLMDNHGSVLNGVAASDDF